MDKFIIQRLLLFTILACNFFSHVALTEEIQDDVIDTIFVKGIEQSLNKAGELKSIISKTELLSSQQLKDKQASSLTDALQAAIGVRVSNECSICGAKRIMINGLKGEHTNVLVNNIPIHTMLSGFYGLDAMAVTGVGTIEIARGAGASLISPEAIGGTINLVSKVPNKNQMEIDSSTGEHGYSKTSLMLTGVNKNGNSQGSLVFQKDTRDQFDGDDNGISESPFLDNQSFTFTGFHNFNYFTNLMVRLNHTDSEVFGGPVLGDITNSIRSALGSFNEGDSEQLFVDDDINGRFVGNPWESAEWVSTKRNEVMTNLLHNFNSKLNTSISFAKVSHVQDSFYEGIDYYADDIMHYLDVRFQFEISGKHFLTFGADSRRERMRSKSNALIDNPNYMSDSFDYDVSGFYIKDSWTPNDKFDAEFALRLDKIQADFIDSKETLKEIEKTLLSPRVDMRYSHNNDLQSRLSFGKGYRAPLSFFESDHGILDAEKGYLIEVTELEKSVGVNYSLSYTTEKLISTFSLSKTKVKNLATLSQTNEGIPVLTQLANTAQVMAIDWTLNYQWTELFNIGIITEIYDYNTVFEESFSIAPIEKRAALSGLWDNERWRINSSASWVEKRDLSKYGYAGFDLKDRSSIKPDTAPGYLNIDMKIVYQLSDKIKLYFGALNLLDYNQASDESSPLLFNEYGGYDVTYIYAPMRGRTAYLGFDLEL